MKKITQSIKSYNIDNEHTYSTMLYRKDGKKAKK